MTFKHLNDRQLNEQILIALLRLETSMTALTTEVLTALSNTDAKLDLIVPQVTALVAGEQVPQSVADAVAATGAKVDAIQSALNPAPAA